MIKKSVVMITGSSKRLGRSIALALAEEGYDLILHYHHSSESARKTKKDAEKIGSKTLLIQGDIRHSITIKKMFNRAFQNFGQIDILINNAAVFPEKKDFLNVTEPYWDLVLDTNLKGTFFCAQEAARIMKKQKRGLIINIASIGAFSNWSGYIPYSVSKTGVTVLTRLLAKTLAPDIRVNAVAPGFLLLDSFEEFKFPSKESILLKKFGRADDIISAIQFLIKNEYITGQVLIIDGGATIK